MFTKNQSGFSFVEALIVAAALGGMALISLNITKMNNKSSIKYGVDSDVHQTINELTALLSDPAKCTATFLGANAVLSTNSITNIDSKFYTKSAQPNASYGNSKLQIDSYQLQATAAEVTADQTSFVIISFVNKNILKGETGPSSFTKKIKLQVTVDADTNIVTCHALGGAIWSRGAGTDIYYNSGNVGVGTNAPTALLEVKGGTNSVAGAIADTFRILGASNSTGEGSAISLTAGSSVGGSTGGSIKLFGGKATGGGSVEIAAGVAGTGGAGTVSITGAQGATSGNQNGGSVFLNGGAKTDVSAEDGNVILANLRGKVAIGTTSPSATALLTVNGPIDTNNTPVILGNTSGDTRGTGAIDIQTSRAHPYHVASGNQSIAIGMTNKASGPNSIAIGSMNIAEGSTQGNITIGNYNTAHGSNNTLFGRYNEVSGSFDNVVIVGHDNVASSGGAILFGRSNTTAASGQDFVVFGSNNAANADHAFIIGSNITNNIANSMQLGPNDAAKMTILSSGNVGIGTTAPSQKLEVAGNITTTGCLLYASGTLGTCASDERIKKDVHPYNVGLRALLGINPVEFKYNGLGGFKNDGVPQLGLIAQQVEKSAPELIQPKMVKLNPNDKKDTQIKAVDYGALTYILINSVKEFYHEWLKENEGLKTTLLSLEKEKSLLQEETKNLKAENEVMNAELERIEKLIQ